MNKARPKRVGPTCGCCELLMEPRAFRKYGPPTKRAIAEQVRDHLEELGAEPILDFEPEVELAVFGDVVRVSPSGWMSAWDDTDTGYVPVQGPDFVMIPDHCSGYWPHLGLRRD